LEGSSEPTRHDVFGPPAVPHSAAAVVSDLDGPGLKITHAERVERSGETARWNGAGVTSLPSRTAYASSPGRTAIPWT